MAFQAHIRLGGVADAVEVPVMSFHWSVSLLRPAAGGPGPAGKPAPHLQDFSFVKLADAHSPGLFVRCCTAEVLPEVSLVARRPGTGPTLRYRFRGVTIASFRPGGSADSADDFPLEEVSLRFEQCEVDYWPAGTDPAGAAPATHGGWSIPGNGPV